MRIHRPALTCSMSILSLAIAAQLHAQTPGLEEIVVTAQKRAESAQETPLAIDVVTADTMIREGIKDMSDLTKASPTLQANTRGGGQNVTIGMRGMQQLGSSPTSDGLVAVHLDGTYLASQWGLSGLMYDLERVEVLAGPQGTLYGRNATAGAINVITRRPGTEFEGNASLEYGDFDTVRVVGGITVPLTDTFSTRLAAQSLTRDSTYTGGGGGRDQWGARLSTLWTPSDSDEVLLTFDYNEFNGEADGSALLGLAAPGTILPGNPAGPANPGGIYTVPSEPYNNLPYQTARGLVFVGDRSEQQQWGVNLQYTHQFSGFSSTLLYGHRDVDGVQHGATKLPTVFSENLTANHAKSDSVELRFASTGDGALESVGGLYYFKNSNVGFFAAPIGPNAGRPVGATLPATNANSPPVDPSYPLDNCPCSGGLFSPSNGTGESYAAFGQTTWTPASLERWHFTIGLRYSYDEKTADLGTPLGRPNIDADGAGPLPAGYLSRVIDEDNWSAVQYKLGAQYDFSDSSLGYASVSTGYKSGGFGYGPTPKIEPEEVVAFEIGSKNRFLDNTLQLNAAAWYYNYSDLESAYPFALTPNLTVFPLSGGFPVGTNGAPISTVNTVTNVGKARLAGASMDTDWLVTDSDQLGLSVTYVYSKVIDGRSKQGVQLFTEGERLGNTPELAVIARYGHTFTLSGGATLMPQVKYQWQSEKYDAATILTNGAPRPNNELYTTIPSTGILDVSLRIAPAANNWDITGYVNNVTDETDIKILSFSDFPPNSPTFGHQTANLGDPRIWGLILNVRF